MLFKQFTHSRVMILITFCISLPFHNFECENMSFCINIILVFFLFCFSFSLISFFTNRYSSWLQTFINWIEYALIQSSILDDVCHLWNRFFVYFNEFECYYFRLTEMNTCAFWNLSNKKCVSNEITEFG